MLRCNNNSALVYGSLILAGLSSCSTKADVKPNVVLILTDDQGWGDFGFNGNEVVQTPTLDSISEISAHLTNFYVSPLSATSRAGLLTGRYHLRTGAFCVTRAAENMDAGETTLAEVMRDNGYATGCFGKWHSGISYPQDPNGQGFAEFYGFKAGHLTQYFNSPLMHNQTAVEGDGYITDVLTNQALKFIEYNKEKPFLCYIPYNAPHGPYQVPDEYYNKYAHIAKDSTDTTPAIYAMCENLDDNLRRLFAGVEEMGLTENTIFVFLTDNGPQGHRYNGELKGVKGQSWDGGFKVPCLVYWKGKVVASEISETLSYVDVMPTILDLCGIEYDAERPLDGTSFSSLVGKGKDEAAEQKIEDRYLYTHRSTSDIEPAENNSILFNKTYRLLRFAGDKYELYNIVNDPSQKTNLVDSEPELFSKLKAKMDNVIGDVYADFGANSKRMVYVGGLENYTALLEGNEAHLKGEVTYALNPQGWSHDWITNIHSADTISWDIEVLEDAEYDIAMNYALREGSPSVSIGVSVGDTLKTIPTSLPYFNAEPIETNDRVKVRTINAQTWNTVNLGTLTLSKGRRGVHLNLPHGVSFLSGFEIKSLSITKRQISNN